MKPVWQKAAPFHSVQQSVYGLTEWNAELIRQAPLIANPGCYSTAVLLSLLPLVKRTLNRS